MKSLTSLLTGLSLIALTGCATIIEGSSDTINLTTTPPMNATCTLINKRGTYNSFTPSQTTVQKSISDLNVSCMDPQTGATGKSTIVSEVEPWDFGNILLGGIIGMGIDWSTGAAYDYPNNATVAMTMPVSYAPQPVDATGVAQPVPMAPTYQSIPAAPMYQQPVPQMAPAPVYQNAPAIAPVYQNAPAPAAAPLYQPAPRY